MSCWTRFEDAAFAFDLLDKADTLSADGDKHHEWIKILKHILRAILNYHIIPTDAYDTDELGRNMTYPTNLRIDETLDGQALRLRVTQTYIPPVTRVNSRRRVSQSNIEAANGAHRPSFQLKGLTVYARPL